MLSITKYKRISEFPADTKFVIYGVAETGMITYNTLLRNGRDVLYFIDRDYENYDTVLILRSSYGGGRVIVNPPEKLKDDVTQNNICVIVTISDNKSVVEFLESIRLIKSENILFANYWLQKQSFSHKPDYVYEDTAITEIVFTNELDYCDDKGNRCFVEGGYMKSTIILSEGNNTLFAKKSNQTRNLLIKLYEESRLTIGENSGCMLNTLFYLVNSEVNIGDNLYCASPIYAKNTNAIIGDDCVFSSNISLFVPNHSIFNSRTKQRKEHVADITIGNHVWIGESAKICSGAKIGNGSVVGVSSVVTRTFPNNCSLAGVPARILHKDICWGLDDNAPNIYECVSHEYINLTESEGI